MIYEVSVDGEAFTVELKKADGETWRCRVNGREFLVDAARPAADVLSLIVDGRSFDIQRDLAPGTGEQKLALRGANHVVTVRDPRALRGRGARDGSDEGPRQLKAPMPGKVVRVLAPAGTQVESGQGILVIEAMKMQNELKSPKAGTVRKLVAAEGTAVNAGDVLAVVE